MRDVNSGWAIRYIHANVASFFFIFVYAHIARGLFYSSYREPRYLVWAIGVIILILMMAELLWPICILIENYYQILHISYLTFLFFFLFLFLCKSENLYKEVITEIKVHLLPENYLPEEVNTLYNLSKLKENSSIQTKDKIVSDMDLSQLKLPFNKSRTKAILRIGAHNQDILSVIICGMLGDWWSDTINSRTSNSVRFQIEQSVTNSAYIHYLTQYFYDRGYCSNFVPKLVKKSEGLLDKRRDKTVDRFNYRLTLFTFSSFIWIHDGFYLTNKKQVPNWISEFITPLGLAHWIMQDGSRQKGQGMNLATNSFTYEECDKLAKILTNNFGIKTSVVKSGKPNQWKLSIWKQSLPLLREIIFPFFIPEMMYKIND